MPTPRALILACWAAPLLCAALGLVAFVGGYWAPGYDPILRAHVLLGQICVATLVIGLLLHIRATASAVWPVALCLGLGSALAWPAPWALVLPEEMHDCGPWGYLVDSVRALLAGTLEDPRPLLASISLALVLTVGGTTALVGLVSRVRERAASRWTGASLTLLTAWAVVGGLRLDAEDVRALVPAQTLHSFAGMAAIALTALHLFAQRAARSGLPRPVVVVVGALAMLLFFVGLQVRYLTLARVEDRRQIEPMEIAEDRIEVVLPDGADCPCEARARWRYRRWNPEFSAWVLGDPRPLAIWEATGAWAAVK